MLDRSQTATANIVAQQGLYKEIEDKRKILLMEVFNNTPDSTKGIF
jgi:GTP1/Obg family GTP-binding protein